MSYKYKAAVFIGRFQPFHKAHLEIVKEALKIAETVIISIGSSKRPNTIKNPWSFEKRMKIIEDTLIEYAEDKTQGHPDWLGPAHILDRVKFTSVRDFMYDNTEWGAEVYSKAIEAGATQDKSTCLVGAFKDDSSWYLNYFPQWDLVAMPVGRHKGKILNATDIRNCLFEGHSLSEIQDTISNSTFKTLTQWINSPIGEALADQYEFIKDYKVKHLFADSNLKYKPIFVTVDAVTHKSGHILMIRRKHNPGKGLYALPGGFVDYGETVEDSAIRELKEETRIDVPVEVLKNSIVSTQMFDHPKRDERGRTITHGFLIDLGKGPLPYVKGDDDAAGAHWIHIRDISKLEEQIYEDHYDIISRLTSRLK